MNEEALAKWLIHVAQIFDARGDDELSAAAHDARRYVREQARIIARLERMVEAAYIEGWQDAHTQKATHGPLSVTTTWEVSKTRAALKGDPK